MPSRLVMCHSAQHLQQDVIQQQDIMYRVRHGAARAGHVPQCLAGCGGLHALSCRMQAKQYHPGQTTQRQSSQQAVAFGWTRSQSCWPMQLPGPQISRSPPLPPTPTPEGPVTPENKLTTTAPLPLSCTSTTCAEFTTVADGGRGALISKYCSPCSALA
jgi:hypothetical protein